MPANWTSFISNVSAKFQSQGIKDSDDLADFLTKQYISATVGKAQSPFGNLHQKGNDSIMRSSFAKAFKMLEMERSPSFEDKSKDPQYQDLEESLPETDATGSADQVELDFRDWAEANKETIPPFRYSQFFSQFPSFPEGRNQVVKEIARRLIFQFSIYPDSSYIQWLYSLRYGGYSDWGREVLAEITKIIKEETTSDFVVGEDVQGFAKFESSVRFTGRGASSRIKNTLENTDIDKVAKLQSGNLLLRGKIASVTQPIGAGSPTYKISYYDKDAKKYFIKELRPGSIQKRIKLEDLARTLEDVNITDRIFQEQNISNPNKIPKYLTSSFIVKFSYSPSLDKDFVYRAFKSSNLNIPNSELRSILSSNEIYSLSIINLLSGNFGFFGSNISSAFNSFGNSFNLLNNIRNKKLSAYKTEEERYRKLKIRWIEEIANEARKNEDPDKPEDPYYIMAKGVIDYWKSTISQPLSSSPPVPPAVILPPQGGKYLPIYYGSQTNLANYLRRAFNSGKRFKSAPEIPIASNLVATAIAFSFAMHLLELKFIYRGGIPTTGSPAPMIGFVPLVF
jgi:hypothetical protein